MVANIVSRLKSWHNNNTQVKVLRLYNGFVRAIAVHHVQDLIDNNAIIADIDRFAGFMEYHHWYQFSKKDTMKALNILRDEIFYEELESLLTDSNIDNSGGSDEQKEK